MVHTNYLSGIIKYLQPLTITSKFYTKNNNLRLTQETISYCYYDHWHHQKKNQDKTVHFHDMVGKVCFLKFLWDEFCQLHSSNPTLEFTENLKIGF